MAVYLMDRLVSDPDNIQVGGMLDGVDWYILPLVNPDGYEYSRSSASVSIFLLVNRLFWYLKFDIML